MPTTIHLVRHAQGFHNLAGDCSIRDPDLTPLGLKQSRILGAHFSHKDSITHIVASPMKRTLNTAYYAFQDLIDGNGGSNSSSNNKQGIAIIANPDLQECSELACDVGSAPEALKDEFGAVADLGLVRAGWNVKTAGSGSRYAADDEALEARARAARRWLRELGRSSSSSAAAAPREENAVVVVVSHGDFIHVLLNERNGKLWANAEYRTYEFVHPDENDEDAFLREIQQPVQQVAKV